jgi:hypothetical protein
MEKDTPEQQQPDEPTKHTRVRLASPRKQLERTIQKMAQLSETPMKAEKQVDLLTTMAGLQVKLLDMDRDAKLDAFIEEIEQLKSELAASKNQSDAALQRMLEQINGERLKNEAEVRTLKAQTATLQAQNAEIMTSNAALKSEKSELILQVPTLRVQIAELKLAIKTLESRTAEELYAEARAKAQARLNPT